MHRVLSKTLSCFFIFIFTFRAAPAAYGSSQARVELELQLPAYTIATATLDLSHICYLHCSLQQCQILNPLSKAKDQTHISWILIRFLTHWATVGTPVLFFFLYLFISWYFQKDLRPLTKINRRTITFRMDNPWGPAVQHSKLYSISWDMMEDYTRKGMCVYIYIYRSFCCPEEISTTL